MKTEITNTPTKNEGKKLETIAEVGTEAKPKHFLTKGKIIFIVVFALISIGCTLITIFPILNVNWHDFNRSFALSFTQKIGVLWLFLILVSAFININRNFITLLPRIRAFGYHISYKDSLIFGTVINFLMVLTPLNFVSDPYTVFWMKTKGVPISRATSILFSNTLIWQVAQIIVNIPFFTICAINANLLLVDAEGTALFTMICIGVAFDIIGLVLMFLINFSKNFHYFCARVFNWFKKIFKMKYSTKEQTAEKYKKRAVMKQDFIASMKDKKTTSWILFLWVAGEVLNMFYMPFCLYFMQYFALNKSGIEQIVQASFNFGWTFTSSRLAVCANRINFLPGQAMGLEASLVKLLNVYSDFKIIPSTGLTSTDINNIKMSVSKNAVVLSKMFVTWLPAFIGLFGFIVLTKQQIKQSKQGKL